MMMNKIKAMFLYLKIIIVADDKRTSSLQVKSKYIYENRRLQALLKHQQRFLLTVQIIRVILML